MNGLLGLILIVSRIWEIFCFFALVGLYTGFLDEARHEYSSWKDVFYVLRYCTVSIILVEGLMIGIQWFVLKETPLINSVFLWGLRVVASISFLRVLWPAKHWWSDTAPAPRYPRLKLFIYSLLALVLSFVPSLFGF